MKTPSHLGRQGCSFPFWALTLGVSLAAGPTVFAAESPHADSTDAHLHRHHFSLFGGGTTIFPKGDEETETSSTVGIEYEYRLDRPLGIGLLYEEVFAGDRERLLLAPISWHAWRGLRLSAGPGMEFRSGQTEFAFRAAASYEFELGHGWTLAPEIAGDFIHDANSLVFGLSIGWGF